MENRDVTARLQPALDLKAPGRGNVLQIHPAKGAGNQIDGPYNLINIVAPDAQRESIDPSKLLEQDTLALHDRHSRFRPDVSQAQDGRAVCHHQAHVPAPCQVVRTVYILLDLQTGLCDARRIRQGQVMLVFYLHRGDHFDLSALLLVQPQTFLCNTH